MPSFKRTSAKRKTIKKRSFVVRSDKQSSPVKKSPVKASSISEEREVVANPSRTQSEPRKPKEAVEKSESHGHFEEKREDELATIQKLIEQATSRLSEIDEKRAETHTELTNVDDQEEPEEFNGVSSKDEQVSLLEAELDAARRESRKLSHQIESIKKEFEEEKKKLENSIRDLKKDLRREAPLHGHSFFSLSKDLEQAMESIEHLVDGDISEIKPHAAVEANSSSEPTTPAPIKAPEPAAPAKTVSKEPEKKEDEMKGEDLDKDEDNKNKKPKKKLMITGAVAAVALVGISTILASGLTTPTVDDALVQEYLAREGIEGQGQVQGSQTQSGEQAEAIEQPIDKQPAMQAPRPDNDRHQAAQADVSFAESIWDTVREPMIGVSFEYPSNSVSIVKTDSSLTLIRKSGYIFKVSRVDTGLDLSDYWKQISATSLNYEVEETELAESTALHLTLEDAVDFPGNRYLVKNGDAIMDVWYATPSNKFSPDDIQRVERVLSSLKFE